jgi:hypothetical protein
MSKILILGIIFLQFTGSSFADDVLNKILLKADQSYAAGQYESAITYYNEALEIDPNSARIYNSLGSIYRDKGAPLSDVIWYFNVAINIDPDNADSYQHLGRSYLISEKFDLAERSFKRALELDPNLLSVEFSLAWLYLQGKSQPVDAIYYFKKVLDKVEIPNAYFGLGLAYAMNNDRALALETITLLRSKGQNEMASQLENMIRQQNVPAEPPAFAAPPQGESRSPQTQIVPQTVAQPHSGTAVTSDSSADGVTRVRLRGTFFPEEPDRSLEPYQQKEPEPPPPPPKYINPKPQNTGVLKAR